MKIIIMLFNPVVRGQVLHRVAFFRNDNGMFIGGIEGTIVSLGTDPQGVMVRRSFIDHEHAVMWAKEAISAEITGEVEFEERDGEASRVALTGVN